MTDPSAHPRVLRAFHRPAVWVGLWIVLLALVATGSLWRADQLPEVDVAAFDKIQHFAGYVVLAAWAVMLFARRRAQALAVLGVIAFGIALEIAQGVLTPDRSADSADAMANALGALLGFMLAVTPLAHALERVDRRLFGRALRRPGK